MNDFVEYEESDYLHAFSLEGLQGKIIMVVSLEYN